MAFMVPVMKSQWAVPAEAKNTGGAGGAGGGGRRPQRRASLPSLGEAARLRSRSRTRKISESAKSDLAAYAIAAPALLSKPSFGRFNANTSTSSTVANAGKKTRSVPSNIVQFGGVMPSSSSSSQTSIFTSGGRKLSRAYTTAAATGTPTSPFAAAVAVRRRFSAALVVDTPDKGRQHVTKTPAPIKTPLPSTSMPTISSSSSSSKQPDKQSKTFPRRLLDKLRRSWKRSSSSTATATATPTTKPSMDTSSSTSLLSLSSGAGAGTGATSTTITPSSSTDQ